MRIFNGTNSNMDIPLSGIQRLQVCPKSVSGDFLPSNEFLSLLVTGYDYSEIALIVSGPYEINMCSSVPGAVGYVVQSLEEAIERFSPKKEAIVEPTKVEIVEPEPVPVTEPKEEVKEEQEQVLESEPEVVEEVVVENQPDEEIVEAPNADEQPGQQQPNPKKKKNNKKALNQ